MPVADMFDVGSHRTGHFLQRTYQGCFLASLCSFGQAVLEENFFFRNEPIRKKITCGGNV
jgi:hypothetical protein